MSSTPETTPAPVLSITRGGVVRPVDPNRTSPRADSPQTGQPVPVAEQPIPAPLTNTTTKEG